MRSILASTFAVLLSAAVALPAMAQGSVATPAGSLPGATAQTAPIAKPAEAAKSAAPARAGAVAVPKDKATAPAAAATPATPAAPAVRKTN